MGSWHRSVTLAGCSLLRDWMVTTPPGDVVIVISANPLTRSALPLTPFPGFGTSAPAPFLVTTSPTLKGQTRRECALVA